MDRLSLLIWGSTVTANVITEAGGVEEEAVGEGGSVWSSMEKCKGTDLKQY